MDSIAFKWTTFGATLKVALSKVSADVLQRLAATKISGMRMKMEGMQIFASANDITLLRVSVVRSQIEQLRI